MSYFFLVCLGHFGCNILNAGQHVEILAVFTIIDLPNQSITVVSTCTDTCF